MRKPNMAISQTETLLHPAESKRPEPSPPLPGRRRSSFSRFLKAALVLAVAGASVISPPNTRTRLVASGNRWPARGASRGAPLPHRAGGRGADDPVGWLRHADRAGAESDGRHLG